MSKANDQGALVALTAVERGREVRQRLLRAAADLIAERGWTAVSTRVLADRAGVAPGLVHYHFSSLPALLTEAATGVLRDAVDGVGLLLERARTVDDALDLMLDSLDRYTGRDPASVLFAETYLAATRDAELGRAVAGILVDFRRLLAGWLAAHGVDAAEEIAAVLAAAIDGMQLHRTLSPELTTATVAPVLRGLLGPSRGGRRRNRRKGDSR